MQLECFQREFFFSKLGAGLCKVTTNHVATGSDPFILFYMFVLFIIFVVVVER